MKECALYYKPACARAYGAKRITMAGFTLKIIIKTGATMANVVRCALPQPRFLKEQRRRLQDLPRRLH